ncbi:MAG: hypothetical protein ABSC06_05255 [Rhodopila sp.]|jgi:hypothetical protein
MRNTTNSRALSMLQAANQPFQALCARVVAGRQTPSTRDLIQGCPFYNDNIRADANALAAKTLGRPVGSCQEEAAAAAFAALAGEPNVDDFVFAAHAFQEIAARDRSPFPLDSAVRCFFYAAVSGDRRAAREVAARAVADFYSAELSLRAERRQALASIAWLLASLGERQQPASWTRETAVAFVGDVDTDPGPGRGMVARMVQSRRNVLATAPKAATINTSAVSPRRRGHTLH